MFKSRLMCSRHKDTWSHGHFPFIGAPFAKKVYNFLKGIILKMNKIALTFANMEKWFYLV